MASKIRIAHTVSQLEVKSFPVFYLSTGLIIVADNINSLAQIFHDGKILAVLCIPNNRVCSSAAIVHESEFMLFRNSFTDNTAYITSSLSFMMIRDKAIELIIIKG